MHLLSENKSEFELYEMRKSLRKRIDEYRAIDWNEILELLVPHELAGSVPIYGRFIGFLRKRIPYLDDIFSQALGIKQQELKFDTSIERSIKKDY